MFDSNTSSDKAFRYKIGQGKVIKVIIYCCFKCVLFVNVKLFPIHQMKVNVHYYI